jgi:hypothetical protein
MLNREDEPAVKHAEQRIQRILIDLEEETGKRVDHVEVDTRNFAQLRTEITLRDGDRA